MMARFAVGVGLVLVFAGVGSSAVPLTLDPEPKTQYVWRVLVQIKPHPLLGATARGQLLKDLRATLVSGVRDELGSVEVIDLSAVPKEKWEPLWAKWGEGGWPALEAQEFRKLTGVKTHFLTVQVKDGKFHLESRQHDGCCGIPSPQVRRKAVTDANDLSREAGLMVWSDFGPVGSVEPLPNKPGRCLIRLRGGDLPGVDRLVKAGDVFTYSVVNEVPRPLPKDAKPTPLRPGQKEVPPTDLIAQPQQHTLLRVVDVPKPGIVECDILSASREPLVQRRGVVGYRALKLTTQDRAVAVRVVGKDDRPPAATTPLEVWATDHGFRDKPTVSDTLALRNGVYTSGRGLRGVACVWVKLGSGATRPFVLPVMDTGVAHTIRFEFNEDTVRAANFENEVERFQNRVNDARATQEELFIALRGLIDKRQNLVALERATNGLKTAEADDKALATELARLQADPLAKGEGVKRSLGLCEQLLGLLRQGKPELENSVANLKTAIEKANNPAEFERQFKANELARQIANHERRGEVPEALAVYDELYELTKQDEVKERKKKLEEEWAPKSQEQAAARKEISEDWAKLSTLDELKGGLPKLKQAVNQLVTSQDRLGLRLAVTGLRAAYVRLGEVVNTLDPELVQDRQLLQTAKTLRDDMQKVEETAQAEVNKLDGKK